VPAERHDIGKTHYDGRRTARNNTGQSFRGIRKVNTTDHRRTIEAQSHRMKAIRPVRFDFVRARALLLAGIAVALGLSACEPDPQKRAQAEQRRQQECLDKICDGDVTPKYNWDTEAVFKRAGRWFIGPKEYGTFDGSLGFFWPSKTPSNKPGASKYAPEFIPSGPGRVSNGSDVTIQFFIQSGRTGEMYPEIIEEEKRRDNIAKWETLRPGLDLVTLKHDPASGTLIFIATETFTPAGVPAVLSCRTPVNSACTMGFTWKGLPVYVRFDRRHAKDWPEIFAEILRVIAQVREV
jgi:hypothetical protein